MAVVDECKPRALPTTILRPEAEARDLVFVRFVQLCELLAQFVFGHIGAVGVEDVTVSEASERGELAVGCLKWVLSIPSVPS